MSEEKLTELLPWYVNGTLNSIDRAWVDAYLAEHPESRGELQWYQTLQVQIRESSPAVAEDIGLNRAMARIQAEQTEIARASSAREASNSTAASRPATRPSSAPSFSQRLRDWFGGLSANALRPALGVALAVMAVQSVVLVNTLNREDEASQIRAVRPAAVAQGPVIKINFKSDATEADIRVLLVQIEGTMAGGPGQLGDWYVRVPAKRIDTALAAVKASKFVDASVVMDAVPARD